MGQTMMDNSTAPLSLAVIAIPYIQQQQQQAAAAATAAKGSTGIPEAEYVDLREQRIIGSTCGG